MGSVAQCSKAPARNRKIASLMIAWALWLCFWRNHLRAITPAGFSGCRLAVEMHFVNGADNSEAGLNTTLLEHR